MTRGEFIALLAAAVGLPAAAKVVSVTKLQDVHGYRLVKVQGPILISEELIDAQRTMNKAWDDHLAHLQVHRTVLYSNAPPLHEVKL